MSHFTIENLKPYKRMGSDRLCGFLHPAVAMTYAATTGQVVTHHWTHPKTGARYCFFSDDHLFGYGSLPNSVVPCSSDTTHVDLTNGKTPIERLQHYTLGDHVIESFQELCDLLNEAFGETA